MTDKACVYDIVWKGEVVYVGMTSDTEKRLKSHRASGVAPDDSAKLVLHKWYTTRKEAALQERLRQSDLLPPFCGETHIQAGIQREWILDSLALVFEKHDRVQFNQWAQIWCDPWQPSDKVAYESMPEEVKANVKTLSDAQRVFGKRKAVVKELTRSRAVQ